MLKIHLVPLLPSRICSYGGNFRVSSGFSVLGLRSHIREIIISPPVHFHSMDTKAQKMYSHSVVKRICILALCGVQLG